MKPVYYEDLEDDKYGDNICDRYRFQNLFTLTITLFQSLAFCAILDYTLYHIENSDLRWQEQVGVVGGCLSLYTGVQNKIGKILIVCFMRNKRKIQDARRISADTSQIEMTATDPVHLT